MKFKVGDRVIDSGGFVGTIIEATYNRYTIRVPNCYNYNYSSVGDFYQNRNGLYIFREPNELSLIETKFEKIMYGIGE